MVDWEQLVALERQYRLERLAWIAQAEEIIELAYANREMDVVSRQRG